MRKPIILAVAAAILILITGWANAAAARQPPAKIHVMLLTGESGGSYHNWRATTPVMKKILDETGLFDVDVVTAPTPETPAATLTDFHPDWSAYQVIVWNYDAPDVRWPESLKQSYEQYMRNGGGMVTVHAADNAFPGWKAFNEMIGVGGWRGRNQDAGPHWFYTSDAQRRLGASGPQAGASISGTRGARVPAESQPGPAAALGPAPVNAGKLTSDDSPGNAGRHGRRIPFLITVRDPNHPIVRGLPLQWMHQGDELYNDLRGPGQNMTILATAYSDPANSGSGDDEPMLMVLRYGKGRIFHSTLGHDVMALSSVDAVVTLQRGTEWAATGKVTQKVPAVFPDAHTVAYRSDLAAMDPNYQKGLNPLDMNMPARGRGARRGPFADVAPGRR